MFSSHALRCVSGKTSWWEHGTTLASFNDSIFFRAGWGQLLLTGFTFPRHHSFPELPGASEFQDVVENALFKEFKARPHWGKNHRLNGVKVQQCYAYDKLCKWHQVFQLFNKGGLFNNRFTHNVGCDSFLINQQATGLGAQLTVSAPSPRE